MPASRKRGTEARRRTAASGAGETGQPAKSGDCNSPPCYLAEIDAAGPGPGEPDVRIKRIYDPIEVHDGYRVLIDRLWPRGIVKARAALDEWPRELAPSTELRKWLHADPARWSEFVRRYRVELQAQGAALETLRSRARAQRLTLLYAARDRQRNHAWVLRDVLLAPPLGEYRGFG